MIGCTENEARWSLSPTEDYTPELLENMVGELAADKTNEVLALLNKGGGSVFEKLDRLYTMAVWVEPAFSCMKRFVEGGRTVFYMHFNRSSPEAVVTNRLASHGTPVPYLFKTMADDGTYDAVDERLSYEMMFALVEFAKTGVPRSTGGVEWPAFSVDQPRETLISETISAATYKMSPLLRVMQSVRANKPSVETTKSRRQFEGP